MQVIWTITWEVLRPGEAPLWCVRDSDSRLIDGSANGGADAKAALVDAATKAFNRQLRISSAVWHPYQPYPTLLLVLDPL